MARAYSPSEVQSLNIPSIPFTDEWAEVFGLPSMYDRWFIGGESASGKSSFVMLLAKKLCEYGSVLYWSLEEGVSLSFQKRLKEHNMEVVNRRFKVVTNETLQEFSDRLAKKKSAHFIIIDSVQYVNAPFKKIKKLLLDRFPRKAFIFVSQQYKGEPKGKTANDLKFDAGVKIYTKGFRAYCQGRYMGDSASYYTIWREGAARYYLD